MKKNILTAFFILMVLNLVVLDVWVFKNVRAKKPSLPTPQSSQGATPASCPSSCLSQIYQATASIKLVQPTFSIQPTKAAQAGGLATGSTVKEFFIPLGAGVNSTDDWTDVIGIQAYIDSTQYGQIKTVTFEASVHIPTGNETAYVRLFNATDKHPVWFSEVSLEGGTPQLLISKPITLDAGNKLYQVQMKTSLKYPAILDQSRVHITTY